MGIADKVRGGREGVRLDGVDLAGEHVRAGSRDGEKVGKREEEAGGQLGSIRLIDRRLDCLIGLATLAAPHSHERGSRSGTGLVRK